LEVARLEGIDLPVPARIAGMDTGLINYYSRRGSELEKVYEKPERQENLASLRDLLSVSVRGEAVLELACGTGYWTKQIAQVAKSVTALDASGEMLEIAREKLCTLTNVEIIQGDVFALPSFSKQFSSCCSLFLLSHIRRNEIPSLLEHIHSVLKPGTLMLFADNRFVPASNTPIAETTTGGDSYQERLLPDGSRHRVLKNFYSHEDLENIFRSRARELKIIQLRYYWAVTYRLPEY
jgi:ubiquinone/menaquinone biosynthesis C-methylase UbiE